MPTSGKVRVRGKTTHAAMGSPIQSPGGGRGGWRVRSHASGWMDGRGWNGTG
ncbi:hypothetical protein BDY21DRAFT_338969 [Lineolata rhizophorae]|uniref:Uncharacterized protein n=1 Tax=Lineolata rhizophorae TaxID=578093 RepID=A0A6A6P4Z0_9PEZI|nr:hypothetical protein BDY21DRAFT_338969 [Lineolata rhizophorae]